MIRHLFSLASLCINFDLAYDKNFADFVYRACKSIILFCKIWGKSEKAIICLFFKLPMESVKLNMPPTPRSLLELLRQDPAMVRIFKVS